MAQPGFIMPEQDITKVLDQMKKWNYHFDDKDVYSFLERINELRQAYAFSEAQIVQGFPQLLRGDALLWFRNISRNVTSWVTLEKALKDFFLSPEERRNLGIQISERRQKNDESIRAYVTALMTLMRRLGGSSEG